MPIYEYACLLCKEVFDLFRGVFDDSKVKCPRCGKLKTERRITAPNFILKGSGFYVTDHKAGKSETKDAKPEKPKAKDKSKTPKKA